MVKNPRICPKCGNNQTVGVTYCEGENWSWFNRKPCMIYYGHLHCYCREGLYGGCGASWVSPPLDQPGQAPYDDH